MARPRIFISSTYFDLRQVRADLENFIRELGYEAVMHEHGHIAYGKDRPLEDYCYQEIPRTHIVVAVVGGRFGSASHHAPHSITQMEIRKALELGKQVYIFVDRNVHAEYRTYEKNKGNDSIVYGHADRPVYEFIEHLYGLQRNNAIFPFESAQDIVTLLREQWAGLFQAFLEEYLRQKDRREMEDLQATARSLKELETMIREHAKTLAQAKEGHAALLRDHGQAVSDVLLSTHPAMRKFRELLGIKHRVYFTTRNELSDWLTARRFTAAGSDEKNAYDKWVITYADKEGKRTEYLFWVDKSLFDERGRLLPVSDGQWSGFELQYGPTSSFEQAFGDEPAPKSPDEDIPF